MDRPIVYSGALPRATDFLSLAQDAMVALAKLSETALGTSTVVDGFTLVPTTPATLSATLGAGTIYEQEDLEGTAYSSLPANTNNVIVKQGIALNPQTLTFAPPTTVGYSQCFLVEASYQDSDTGSTVLPYYNAANPMVPYSGPGNAGTANNTVRQGAVAVQVKAGIAAPAGTQIAPTQDAGFVGLFVVTLSYGATTVTQGNISTYANAPFLRAKLGQIPQAFQNDQFNGFADQGTTDAVVVNPVPALTQYLPFQRLRVKMANAPTGATTINVSSLGALPLVRPGGSALAGGEWSTSDFVELVCTGSSWQLIGLNSVAATSLWHTGTDTSTSAAAITATATPAVPTRIADLAYLIFPANACAGATTLNVGFGAQPLTRNDAKPLQAGDYASGQPLVIIDDGTQFRVAGYVKSQLPPDTALVHYGTDTGSTNAITASVSPSIASYSPGYLFNITTAAANTGPATANINGIGVANIVLPSGAALSGGEYIGGAQILLAPTTSGALMLVGGGVANQPKFIAENLTYYVNGASGNDSNSGLSAGQAWATLQRAVNVLSAYNFNGFAITVNVASGTYGGVVLNKIGGNGSLVFQGNNSSPSNCVISGVNSSAIIASGATGYTFSGFLLQTSGTPPAGDVGAGLFATAGAQVSLQYITFAGTVGPHVAAANSATVSYGGNIVITGSPGTYSGYPSAHLYVLGGGNISSIPGTLEPVLNVSAAINVSAFIASQDGFTEVLYQSMSGTGNVAGSKFSAALNGVIFTGGQAATYYPGSSAGTTATGGQYG